MISSTLDVVIGIIFIFLLFSLVVSAANEIWLSFLDKRAQYLKQGLQELFRDSSGSARAIGPTDILQHGLIASLSRGEYDPEAENTQGVPSYIPGKSFVLALLSVVQKRGASAGVAVKDLRGCIEKLENEELKDSLLALYDDSHDDLDHFKANLENWFNESMDRVSGWYTRYAKQWLLALGLILAVVGNVNIIHIGQFLASPQSEAQRKAIADTATRYAQSHPEGITKIKPAVAAPTSSANDPADVASPSPASNGNDTEVARFKAAYDELQGSGVPINWGEDQRNYFYLPRQPGQKDRELDLSHVLTALAGWIVTALAASLGAPFWFDTLNRFIDIRSNGRAPEEADPTAPKKQSTGVESYVVTGDSRASRKESSDLPETGVNPQTPAHV